jgi:hypothetical protein
VSRLTISRISLAGLYTFESRVMGTTHGTRGTGEFATISFRSNVSQEEQQQELQTIAATATTT